MKRILVIESDNMLRGLLAKLLQNEHVETVERAEDGIIMLLTHPHPFDIVIVNQGTNRAEISGGSFSIIAKEIKKKIRVIITYGHSEPHPGEHRADAFLEKAFNPAELRSVLKNLFEKPVHGGYH